jgi:Bacterial dnaA protein helix-turn-helix
VFVIPSRAFEIKINARAVPDRPIDLNNKSTKLRPFGSVSVAHESKLRLSPKPSPTVIDSDIYAYILPLDAPSRKPPVRRIQKAVAFTFNLSVAEMLAQRRELKFLWPRQVSIGLCRRILNLSQPTLGRLHGNRDHTTILNSLQRFDERVAKDADFVGKVRAVLELLRAQKFAVPTLAELGIEPERQKRPPVYEDSHDFPQ